MNRTLKIVSWWDSKDTLEKAEVLAWIGVAVIAVFLLVVAFGG